MTTYELPTKIVQKDWPQFLRHYAAVIEDCPLNIHNPEKTTLQHITHVTVDIQPDQFEHGRLASALVSTK